MVRTSPHQQAQRPLAHRQTHPQRTSDLVRVHQATDSSTRSRAADLRPRLMPFKGIRLPAHQGRNLSTKRSQPHRHRNHHLAARLRVLRRVGLRPPREGRRSKVGGQHQSASRECEPTGTSALPGGHDRSIMVRTFLPPSAGQTSSITPPIPTHSGPLTSSGASRPRTAAREAVLRTSDLA